MQTIHGFSPFKQTLILSSRARSASKNPLYSSSSSHSPRRRLLRHDSTKKSQTLLPVQPNLKKLTSRIVQLTRRRQLRQILDEVEVAKQQYGKQLNTIVMNAVMEACVHCGEIDSALQIYQQLLNPESCGVDHITLGILLKGLGKARRIDEAFQLLESIAQGNAPGNQKLSPGVICGLLNVLIEAGDLRRANGLLASYHSVLHEGGPSIQMYNLLMKGYINAGFPEDALTLHVEILRRGLKPDRLTYNTMLFACVKAGKMNAAMGLFSEMKDEAQNITCPDLFPDAITFTTLLKGFGHAKDLHSVQKIVMEMKSSHALFIDRIAYTAMVDALLICGSTKGALCIFGEIQKLAGGNPNLRPKPHLYLSMMRAFAVQGNFIMVKSLHSRMWPDTSGVISLAVQVEADELLMEAALNNGQVDVARQILSNIITKWEGVTWTSRGSLVAVKVEALSGFTKSTFSPSLLPKVLLDDPIENIMTSFEETRPLRANLHVKDVLMHFFRCAVVPIIDEWGSCVGMVHREDCNELNAPLSKIMQSPPPYVTTSTSIGRVINLVLEKKYKMVIVVKPRSLFETGYNSSLRPVGVFTSEQLSKIAVPASEGQESCICRIST